MRRRYFNVICGILGLALTAALVAKTGIRSIVERIDLLGYGFIFLLLISGARYLLRTISWHLCIDNKSKVGLSRLFGLMLMGEALNDMCPGGPVVGDTARIIAASTSMPAEECAISASAERLIYSMSIFVFLLSGGILLLLKIALPEKARVLTYGLILISIICLIVIYRIIKGRCFVINRMLDHLKWLTGKSEQLKRYDQRMRSCEANLHDFFANHRRIFGFVFSIEFMASVISIGEAYFILRITGTHIPVITAVFVEMSNRVAQGICNFMPFSVGIEEATAGAALHALGYGMTAGVSLGIIRKLRSTVWIGLGLLVSASYVNSKRAEISICEEVI